MRQVKGHVRKTYACTNGLTAAYRFTTPLGFQPSLARRELKFYYIHIDSAQSIASDELFASAV